MPGYEVQQVSLLPERLPALRGAELDSPHPGSRGNSYVLHVIGWVVGGDVPATAVEVVYHDRVIRTAPVRGGRADVAQALGDIPADTECAFHALIGLVGLKLHFELGLRVVLADGTRVPIGNLTVSRTPLQSDFNPMLQPLMLTCLGRTGSTWVMKLLAAHPQIVIYRRFPYESTPAKYWLHMLRVLSEPGNQVESAQADTFHNNLWWVGKNPYCDESVFEQAHLESWFARTYVERLGVFCQQNIEDWYLTLARGQGQEAPAYFAEKHMWPNFIPVLAWELYPRAKEVFLVRDFRDMALSIMAFDKKRGYAGFGRPDGASDEEYLRKELRQMALDLQQGWLTRGERAFLVRYEDLVHSPEETLTGLLGYLELDASPESIGHMLTIGAEAVPALPGASHDESMIGAHRTTRDLESSIGRWKHEGDAAFKRLCQEVFAQPLATFGYTGSS